MKPSFTSAKILYNRAIKHLNELTKIEDEYNSSNPYTVFTTPPIGAAPGYLKVRVNQRFPTGSAAVVFDIVNCLRSALDHAVYDAAVELGNNPAPKNTKFPFGRTKEAASTDLNRKKAEIPDEMKSFLLDYEPYEGGKLGLHYLNALRNEKIHRLLSEMYTTSHGMGFRESGSYRLPGADINIWDAEKSELTIREFYSSPGSALPIVYVSLVFASTALEGQKAIPTINKFAKHTLDIIQGIQAETARLKTLLRQ